MRYEVVTANAPLGEGPVWCPDGTLVISLISPGGLLRIRPESGKTELLVSARNMSNIVQSKAHRDSRNFGGRHSKRVYGDNRESPRAIK